MQGHVVLDKQASWLVTVSCSTPLHITPRLIAADNLLLIKWATSAGCDGWCCSLRVVRNVVGVQMYSFVTSASLVPALNEATMGLRVVECELIP